MFDYWNVNGSSEEITQNPLVLPVGGYETVMAYFSARKLTVLKDGEGQVRVVSPGTFYTPPFTRVYGNEDTEVQLTAFPSEGWGFKEWTGDFPGTNPRTTPLLTLLVDRDRTVTPVFAQVELTVDREGEGTVTVTPSGVAQTPSFTETYGIHQTVDLMANPECGWDFSRWEGEDVPTGQEEANPLGIGMTEDKTVTAVFEFDRPLVIVLSGEQNLQGPQEPEDIESGVFDWANNLQQQTDLYDFTLFDEDHVEDDGSGEVFDFLVAAINAGTARRIAIVGHSHGGGSTHDLCARLSEDPDDEIDDTVEFEIIMTGYVDAIQNTSDVPGCRDKVPAIEPE